MIQKILATVKQTNKVMNKQTNKTKQKRLFPKFQLIPILRLQVMHDHVHWHNLCIGSTITLMIISALI